MFDVNCHGLHCTRFYQKYKKIGEGISVFLPGKNCKDITLDLSSTTVKVVFSAKEKLICQNNIHALSRTSSSTVTRHIISLVVQ